MLTRHHIVKFVRLGSGNNCTPAVRAALDECRRNGTKGLLFPAGTYHFYPEGTEEKYCYISNNDSGFKKIVFLLKGLSEFSIIGENSRFIFHGRIIPFVVEDCRQINLCGFSVDFDRSFISRAEVLTIGKDWMDLQLTADDLYRIEDDRIVFFDDLYRHLRPYLNFMEFDIERQ